MTIHYLDVSNPDGGFQPRRRLIKSLKIIPYYLFNRRQACPSVQAGFVPIFSGLTGL